MEPNITQEKRAFIEKTVDKILKEKKIHKFTKKEILVSLGVLLVSLAVICSIIIHYITGVVETKRRVASCLDNEFCVTLIQNLPTVTYHCIQDDGCYKIVLKEAPKTADTEEGEEGNNQ